MGEVVFAILIFARPIAYCIIGIIGVASLVKLVLRPKARSTWILVLAACAISVLLAMFVLPNDGRFAITRMRLAPILEIGTSVDEAKVYLERRGMRYSFCEAEECKGGGTGRSRQIPYLHIILPVVFSVFDGQIHTMLFFDDQRRLTRYEMTASWDFI